jgi:hypothetical protein
MDFRTRIGMEEGLEHSKNDEFYSSCTKYFEFLREKGETDYEFEDEYYFTMPAISSN